MDHIRDRVNAQASSAKIEGDDTVRGFGIEIVDVRIKRADLPPANSEGIYKRMQTERQREAAEFRARGAEDAQKIKSQADKERTILLAEARKTAEITRGEGDGEATRIFAQSFGQDTDFFQFYRTLQAYKKSLSQKDTTLILSPNSEFLKTLDKGDTH
jgi:membrane protease subunit HflC